jgi:hypothetical protein
MTVEATAEPARTRPVIEAPCTLPSLMTMSSVSRNSETPLRKAAVEHHALKLERTPLCIARWFSSFDSRPKDPDKCGKMFLGKLLLATRMAIQT